MERDFSELEKLSLFAEIIAASGRSPSTVLLRYIDDIIIEPQWSNIALPPSRTLAQCQRVFHELRTDRRAGVRNTPLQERRVESSATGAARYTPFQADPSFATIGGRFIQPRPPELSASTSESAQSPRTPLTGEPQQKKRGRPTKAETEERRRVAEARGESLPPSRPTKKPKPAGGRVSLAGPVSVAKTEEGASASPTVGQLPEPVSFARPEPRIAQPAEARQPPASAPSAQSTPVAQAAPGQQQASTPSQYRRPEPRGPPAESESAMQLPRPPSYGVTYAPEHRQSPVTQPTASPLGPPTRSFPSDPGRSSYNLPPPQPPPPPPPPPPQTTRDSA